MLPSRLAVPALAALLGLLLATLLASTPVNAAAKRTGKEPGEKEKYSAVAFGASNVARDKRERKTLDTQRCLQRAAIDQAKAMAAAEEMYHQDLRPVLEACKLDHVGENVAFGFDSGEDVVEAWLDSPSHRDNLLTKRWKHMGLAARKGDDGAWYVAQLFGHPA